MKIRAVIFKTLKRYYWHSILLLIVIILAMLLQILPAVILKNIIDDYFNETSSRTVGLLLAAVLYLLITSAGHIVEFFKVILTSFFGQKILIDIRLQMKSRLRKIPLDYYHRARAGDIMSRLTGDVDQINILFSSGIVNMITDLFKIFGLLISLYILSPAIFTIELLFIPFILIFTNLFARRKFGLQKLLRKKVSALLIFLQEWLAGFFTIKAYRLENEGKRRFNQRQNELYDTANKVAFAESLFPCLLQTFKMIITVVVIIICVPNGTIFSAVITIGALTAIVDLIGKLFAPLDALANEFQTIQQSLAGIARIHEFFKIPVENRQCQLQSIDFNAGIVIENVSFAYETNSVINDISLNIAAGKKIVFIGRSGAGKTTLMHLMSGLYCPSKGVVKICGTDPYLLLPRQRRQLLGIVTQMPQVFAGTIAENITLRDENISYAAIQEALSIVGLKDFVESLPSGYDTLLGEGEGTLSNGQLQLLSIARAIVLQPAILFLDEPTANIDSQTEADIYKALHNAGRGRTIISISHRLSGALDADEIYLMREGQIISKFDQSKMPSNLPED